MKKGRELFVIFYLSFLVLNVSKGIGILKIIDYSVV